jgi:hypothetical protein
MEHSRQMPMWKIAVMLCATFSYPKHDIIEDEDYVPPRRAPGYAVVPSIAAITSKLMNCIYLETGGELGYMTTKPSELQTQVWEHLLQSRQHHAMIQAMKSSSSSDIAVAISLAAAPVPSTPIKTEQEEDDYASCVAPGAPMKPKQQQQQSRVRISIGRVRVRDSDDEEEFKSEQPPTKRRKIIFDDDDEVASETPTEMQTYTPTAAAACADALQFQFDEVADALSEIEQEISDGDAPVDTTSADMMYSGDEDDGYDVYNDAENSYNTHYQQHMQQQHEQQQQEMHAAIMAALNRISEHEQQIGELSSRVSEFHAEIETVRHAIAGEVATLSSLLNPQDAAAMSECDGEYCQHDHDNHHPDHYFVDGHQVSSWIYNEEYDDQPQRGDYDHHEECS